MALLTDDEYSRLQNALTAQPDAGVLIKGGGGIRKIRWAALGRGKSGGTRIIYYWATESGTILMLTVYPKNEKQDLSDSEVAALRKIVEEEFR